VPLCVIFDEALASLLPWALEGKGFAAKAGIAMATIIAAITSATTTNKVMRLIEATSF
jgi:hypothetical protein